MASQRDEANPGLTVDEEDNGLSPCSVVALVPPARLALAHASAYRTWFDLRGAPPGAELHLKLDDSPTKRLLTSPAEVALGELGHVGLGTHVLVAWAVAANGSLLRGEGARGAGVVVRFEVFDHEFEGGAR
jgi:hypothetical protein